MVLYINTGDKWLQLVYCEKGFCYLAWRQSLNDSKFNLPLSSNEIFKSLTNIFKSDNSENKFI
jgi:hypothetical protein